MPKNYAVGKGKPPVHTRFKKGQSGNPSGRPKGKVTVADADTVFDQVLSAQIPVSQNGRPRKMSKIRALCVGTVHDALKGDRAARKLVFDHVARRQPQAGADQSSGQGKTDNEAIQELEKYLTEIRTRMASGASNENGQNGAPEVGLPKAPEPDGRETPPTGE
jgi:Family of unknown function (DUF5681)